MTEQEIENRFAFHPANTPKRAENHEAVRSIMRTTVAMLDNLLPESREKSLAVTKAEEVMFWANAAIARQKD